MKKIATATLWTEQLCQTWETGHQSAMWQLNPLLQTKCCSKRSRGREGRGEEEKKEGDIQFDHIRIDLKIVWELLSFSF